MLKREILRFARRNRLLGSAAVLILALGMAASATTFSIMLAIARQQISGIRPGSYVTIARQEGTGPLKGMTWASFIEVRDALMASTHVAAYSLPSMVTAEYLDQNKTLGVSIVSGGFFTAAGVEMAAGDDISTSYENANTDRVVVISERLAIEWFSSPRNAIGKVITIRGANLRITGVASREFRGIFGDSTDIWASPPNVIPLHMSFTKSYSGPHQELIQGLINSPDIWQKAHIFFAIAVDHSSSPVSRAVSSVSSTLRRLQLPDDLSLTGISGLSSDPAYTARILSWARLIFFLTSLVMLVAALNFSGLLLARVPQQIEEVRLKRTLGATAKHLLSELAVGPVLLVACGTIIGMVLTACIRKILPTLSLFSGSLSLLSVHLDASVYLWAFIAGVALSLALAGAPALRLLKDSGSPRIAHTSTQSRKELYALNAVTVSQIAFAITVTLLSGMIYHSVMLLSKQQLGFRSQDVTVAAVGIAKGQPAAVMVASNHGDFPLASATRSILQTVSAIPEVATVAISGNVPMENPLRSVLVSTPEDVLPQPRIVSFTVVSSGYFKTMEIPFITGQDFSPQELTGDINEVVLSKSLADQLWPGQIALNRTLNVKSDDHAFDSRVRVVGVVMDARYAGPKHQSDPVLYLPLKGIAFSFGFPLYVTVRGQISPKLVETTLSQSIPQQIPGVGVLRVYRLSSRVEDALSEDWLRARMTLLGASILLTISYIGLYGALTFFVNFRRRELAIRACFGASPGAIVHLVLSSAFKIGLIGSASAVALWFGLTPIWHTYFRGVATTSLATILIVLGVCLVSIMAVAAIPARTAAQLQPLYSLKEV